MTYRITRLEVQGMKTLVDVRLDLNGMTVLIGENGSGKSTILEACELLRQAPEGPRFVERVNSHHGGLATILRDDGDTAELRIAVHAQGDGPPLHYALALGRSEGHTTVVEERLARDQATVFERGTAGGFVVEASGNRKNLNVRPQDLLIGTFGAIIPDPAIESMQSALRSIAVHPPLVVAPAWAEGGQPGPLRSRQVVQPAEGLSTFGSNMANVYYGLKSESSRESWEAVLDLVRLGVGFDVEDVITRADPGGGRIGLLIRYRSIREPVPAFALSDGTLVYLALVALIKTSGDQSLLAIDEPELHLHPEAAGRIVMALEDLAERVPVLVATQSDRVLDALEDPARSVVLCELDSPMKTMLRRPEGEALASWLADYTGYGHLRSEGYADLVMSRRKENG